MQIKTGTRQTIFDVALEQYGTVAPAILLAETNSIGVGAVLNNTPLTLIDFEADRLVKQYYERHNIKPSSAVDYDVAEYIELINSNMTTQNLDYTILEGTGILPAVKLDNLYKALTIQINYSINQPVLLRLQQSLDGSEWSEILGTETTIDSTDRSFTYNIIDLMTNYVRIEIVSSGYAGVIETIIYKV